MEKNDRRAYLILEAKRLKIEVANVLKSLKTKKQKKIALQKYFCAIHPHFIVWVAAMQNSANSGIARSAALNNIHCELIEDHQIMLYKFMQQIGVQFDEKLYEELFPRIEEINRVMSLGVSMRRGIGPATVIFFLEEISKVFIPWIEETARELGATNFLYTQKHGEADEAHSLQALNAVLAEADITTASEPSIEAAKAGVVRLLNRIFCRS